MENQNEAFWCPGPQFIHTVGSLHGNILQSLGGAKDACERFSMLQTIQSLEKCVQAGDYYEAQQSYKARYAR